MAPPPPAPKAKPKVKSKAGRAAARASKRRKTREQEDTAVSSEEAADGDDEADNPAEGTDTLGGMKWECLAVTMDEYQNFLESIRKSRDPNEKALHARIIKEVMPVIDKMEEEQKKKTARRQKELLNLEKMATAKRSSRIAGRHEKIKEAAEAEATEKKRQVDLAAAKKDAERQRHREQARESRMMTREQRLKEREYKRLLHEEELANLSEDSKKLQKGEGRISERRLKAEMEKKKRELEALQQEEDWVFDCAKCGVHGENVVSPSRHMPDPYADRCRMMVRTASLARGVTFGNTARASVSLRLMPSKIISTSFVAIVRARRRMQRSRSYHHSSSRLAPHVHHQRTRQLSRKSVVVQENIHCQRRMRRSGSRQN